MLQDKTSRGQTGAQDQTGQQLHVSGVFIVILELALVIENTLPILVVIQWLPSCARGVGDRLIAAFSVTCILSALIPTPLGLASYFSGSWYGGSPTCTTYQVTSIWCNLSSLALLAYICINCRFAVKRLVNLQLGLPTQSRPAGSRAILHSVTSPLDMTSLPSTTMTSQGEQSESLQILSSPSKYPARMGRLKINSVESDESKLPSPVKMNGFCDGANFDEARNEDRREESSHLQHVKDDSRRVVEEGKTETHSGTGTFNSYRPDDLDQAEFTDNVEIRNDNNNDIRTFSNLEMPKGKSVTIQDPMCKDADQSSMYGLYDTKHMLRNPLVYEDSTFIYTQSLSCHENSDDSKRSRTFRPRDYVSLVLFFLYSITLAISSLPVVGFGPQHRTNDRMCNSWLVPTPTNTKEKAFFILFLVFVYLCLLLGCASGAQVCLLVNRRLRQESKRTSRLYHEEENVPDIREFSILDDLKRHYSLACLVMSGILTWVPIVVMLTLQKAGVKVSEATLVYSNIATSLPGLLNPLLYSLVLVRYRDGYKAVFEKCCRKSRGYRQHPMKNVGNHRDSDDMCEISVSSSMDGHQTMHCRPNPGFHASSHLARNLADGDDEEDEDCFYEDQDELIHQGKGPIRQKVSEKTPLHVTGPASSNQNSSSVDARAFHTAGRHWPHPADQSNRWDKECLLAHEISYQDDETGL